MVPLQTGANSPPPPSFGNQSTLRLFFYCCIFLLCVFRYVYFIQLASQNVKSARLSVYLPELGPLIRKRVLLPPFGSKRGDTLACGGGCGGTQFQRRDRQLWYSMYTMNFYMCLFGDIRNSIHEKSHGIPRNFTELYDTEFGGIPPELRPIPHGIRNRRK